MTSKPLRAEPELNGEALGRAPPGGPAGEAPKRALPRLRTGVRAGDVYLHGPRGSNNPLSAP